jgi:acetolactate synthase-1/2/3 large subunit
MKVSDYVMDFLVGAGVEDVFTVSGGGIMHLIDSLGANARLRYIANYHEQACAVAAEAYARIRGTLGACLVTTGPGSTNALSGVAGAFVDSVPIVVISGQVRRDLIADYTKVRQLGPQEINIDAMATPITKYFATVMDPARIRYELEKAIAIATAERPGPVWINLPLDVQGASVDPSTLEGYSHVSVPVGEGGIGAAAERVLRLVEQAQRPVIVPGYGVRLAHAHDRFLDLVNRLGVPVATTIGSTDAIAEDHPCFAGRFGPLGQRRANFAIQNADCIVAIGASMSLSTVGFNTDSFAPGATRVMVNVDPHEIEKARPRPHIAIVADAAAFIDAMLTVHHDLRAPAHGDWRRACDEWRNAYPVVTAAQYAERGYVNSYVLAESLSDALDEGDVVLTGNSLDWWSVYQSFKIKRGQRAFTNVNYGSMGWDLPAALGASVARAGQRTVLVTGDGSFQFNSQELQTLAHYGLDVRIFVLNNAGYASIRSMQQTHFAGRLVAADGVSGVSNPDFGALARAYRLRFEKIASHADLAAGIRRTLEGDGPVLCEVAVNPAQERSPRVMSRRRADGSMESGTLENMYPFLPAGEVERNMRLSRTAGAIRE